jgi:hypothetical protein
MRRNRIACAAALALFAAGCSGGGNGSAPAARKPGAVYASKLSAMKEGERNGVFIRAIRDAGLDCQHVDRSAAVAGYRGMPGWTASCGSDDYAILVTDSGTAQVMRCADAKKAGVPICGGGK